MDSTERGFLGIAVLFILMGIYVWFDHGRTLECRVQAQSNGADTVNAVRLCK